MIADPTAYDCFVAALKRLIEHRGRGAQRRLAEALDKKAPYVNDLLQERRNAGQALQEQIASHFEMKLEEMMALGRQILEGNEPELTLPFQDELDRLGKDTLAKYYLIYDRAAADTGYPGVRNYIDRALDIAPDEYKAFEAGEISAYDLYELAKKTLTEDIEDIKKQMRKWEKLTKDVKRKNIEDLF